MQARGETGQTVWVDVLHVLPHRGGGAEAYVDQLELLPGVRNQRVALAENRERLRGAPGALASLPKLTQLARRVDIVHAHGDTASFLSAPVLRLRPSLATTHGLHRLRRLDGQRARAFASGLLAADVTVCTSDAERMELATMVASSKHDRLVTVLNGTEIPSLDPGARAAARSELGLGEDDVAALFVAELEQRKDPLLAASAADAAARRGAPLVLLIAGTGSLAPRVASMSGPNVRALGFRDDVARLYAAGDIFVLPSSREGMSMALLEAMAHGLAVVASDIPGNQEAVGEAGRLLPPGDLGAWTDALEALAGDGAARAELGGAARDRASSELSLDRFLGEMGELYESLAAKGA